MGVAYVLTEVGSTHVSYVMESIYTTLEGIVAHKVAVDVLNNPCSMPGQNDMCFHVMVEAQM
jgi:hypothetical protein